MQASQKPEKLGKPKLTTAMGRLTKAAAQLNKESDALNATLRSVETQIVESQVGLEVWMEKCLSSQEEERRGGENGWTSQFLGFARVDDDWCLAIKTRRYETGFFQGDTSAPYQDQSAVGKPVRLDQSARQLRIAALTQLPDLLEAIAEEAAASAEIINEAKALAE